MNTWSETDEETGLWVIIAYFPHESPDIYGFFNTEAEAWAYAHQHMERNWARAYDVHMVLNAHMQVRREAWE